MVLEKTLESPLECKEIQAVHPKGNQSWIFTGRTDAKAEAPILWPPDVKSQLIRKDPDAGKDWGQEEKGTTEDETVGWHHWLDRQESEQALGDGEGWEAWRAAVRGVAELNTAERLNDNQHQPRKIRGTFNQQPGGLDGTASAYKAGTRIRSLGWEDPLQKEMATHCSILAWKIPWTEEPDRLQSMGSQRVGHNWATSLHLISDLGFYLKKLEKSEQIGTQQAGKIRAEAMK